MDEIWQSHDMMRFGAKKYLRREGVEPPPTGWKPVILPLNYQRYASHNWNL
jgi:hypothetical protein